jgi:hypothetical protein
MNTGFTSIAPQFGRSWSRVTRVYLTDCRYVGALPSSFGSAWSGLEFIDLSGNSFVIPPQFGASWTKLQMFWMRQNGKADPLPAVNSQSNIVFVLDSLVKNVLLCFIWSVVLFRPTAWNEFGQMWSSVESIDMRFDPIFHFRNHLHLFLTLTLLLLTVFRMLRAICRRNSDPIGLPFYLFCSFLSIHHLFISEINEL